MIATYRLSKHIASHDFFVWLVMVQSAGATRILFDTAKPKETKFPAASVMRRFHSIIQPGPALAGLPSELGKAVGLDADYNNMIGWFNTGNKFRRLQSVLPSAKSEFTVTIRNNHDETTGKPIWAERNSNLEVWYRFAEEIKATVIEDYFDRPTLLYERMALYAGARMNFGVVCGPLYMLSLSAYPVTMVIKNEKMGMKLTQGYGLPNGHKFPWMLDNQSLIWNSGDDSIDNLRRVFDGVVR